jgi:hypothetical protein
MNVYEQRSDVRANVKALLTLVLTALVAGQVWFAIDPRPEVLTRVVRGANEQFMSAWALLLGASVAGAFILSRFLIGSALTGTRRGKVPAVLGGASPLCLLAGVLTGMLAEGAAIAVLLAVAARWFTPKQDAG